MAEKSLDTKSPLRLRKVPNFSEGSMFSYMLNVH